MDSSLKDMKLTATESYWRHQERLPVQTALKQEKSLSNN